MNGLTPRHVAILQLMAEGLTSKQIGERLGIKRVTVESHRRTMARRMGVQGLAPMIVRAVKQGLI
jgi:DNA-binding NarL/FixJ family response regulator